MGLVKEVSVGDIPDWPSTFMWGGVARMLDVCGSLHEYENSSNMSAGFMYLFEELRTTHCGKEGQVTAASVGWPLFQEVWLATDTQREAEARVRKLEE